MQSLYYSIHNHLWNTDFGFTCIALVSLVGEGLYVLPQDNRAVYHPCLSLVTSFQAYVYDNTNTALFEHNYSNALNHFCHLLIAVSALYFTDATAYSLARYGQGTGPIHLDNVACTGTEEALVSCAYVGHTSDCFHFEDAGVHCQGKQVLH